MALTRRKAVLYPLYALAFAAATGFLLWKCRYGYAHMDEAFYLTIPYRLCLGDSLLLHEWHPSQLAGFLLYPAMWLDRLLFSDTAGILLRFRYLFTVCWAMAALFFFCRLRRFSLKGAMLASLVFLLYTPYGIMALSYNSMGILLLLNACVLAVSAQKHPALCQVFSGLFFAGAVLCCPYLLALYLLFTAVSLILALRRRQGALRCWLFVSLGCALMLLLFALLLFSRASLAELAQTLPELFNDPEHEPFGPLGKAIDYVEGILGCCDACIPALLLLFLSCALGLWRRGRVPGFILACLAALALVLCFLLQKRYLNYLMFPLCLPGFYCALASKDRGVRRLFWGIWVPGLVYTFCIHLSSNQIFFSISSAATVMTVASVVMLFRFLRCEMRKRDGRVLRAAAWAAALLLLAVQLYGELSLRYSSVFWEADGMAAQTVQAESGPEQGILMTPERLARYQSREADIMPIRSDPSIRKLLVFSDATHLYLSAEKELASFSAWLSGANERSLDRLERYYALLPEKLPDGIYIDAGCTQYAARFLSRGYTARELPSGALWLTKGDAS